MPTWFVRKARPELEGRSTGSHYHLKVDETTDVRHARGRSEGGNAMRFAILVKSTEASEAGEMPGEDSLVDVVTYHEELARAGTLYDATGLHPTREGWRIRYSHGTRTLIEGPF